MKSSLPTGQAGMKQAPPTGMIIMARFSRESGQATPINRGKLWPLKNNYKHMKSSMTQATHGGMTIVARFHVTIEKQL